MLLYIRCRKFFRDKDIFSRWTELGGAKYLLTWDPQNKIIIIKDDKFNIVQDVYISKYKMFRVRDDVEIIINRVIDNELYK